MRSKWFRGAALLFASAILLGYVWNTFSPFSKGYAVHYVRTHSAELTEYARQVIADRPIKELRYQNGWTVNYYADAPAVPAAEIVEFAIGSSGFGSAASYTGFYYSPEDVPLGFQGAVLDLTESARGWTWQEETGDNRQTIEKICENWYWYEARF